MRLAEIGERWQIVRVWANSVRRHRTRCDEAEDTIDHVVGETATIEEAPRA